MFRISVFCQTRSTGLGDSKMVMETIDEFIETVTEVREFSPDSTLVEARDAIIEKCVLEAQGVNAHFRMSMSTSGCFENGRSREGKFGFLKKLIRDGVAPTPIPFSIDNPGGELGTPLWNESYKKADSGDDDLTKVNIAGIRENGKVRVVTSGSFYKDALLQPFSHLTIEMAKSNPIIKDGFRARRLGYAFIEGINILDASRGDVIFEESPIAMSCDWTKATDNPSHESGRFIIGPLLKGIGLNDMQVENILYAWVGDYDMFKNGKYVGKMVNGIPMGNPLTKTNISLAHPICDLYARMRINKGLSSGDLKRDPQLGRTDAIGAGNGDDLVFFIWGQFKYLYAQYYGEAAAMLGYKTSEKDFFITDDWCTYCEEVFRIPTSRFDTVALANRLKDSRYSPGLDFPKGRLIIDTRKDRADFSSLPEGKYTLMGKDMEYVRRDGKQGINFLFSISSAMQDIALGLRYQPKPVYIPRQIFSIGKMVSKWDITSWVRAVSSMKSAWVRNLTQTVIEEINGKREKILTSMKGARTSGQTHFDRESYLEYIEIPEDDPIKQYRVIKAADWDKFPIGSLEKLSGANLLVRESSIKKHYLFQKRVQSLSQDIDRADLFQTMKGIGVELAEFDPVSFTHEAKQFVEDYRDRPWLLNVTVKEDLYFHSIEDILAKADPLRVDLPLDYLKRFCRRPKPDSPYTRELERLYEWFVENYINILDGREYDLPPTQIIEDDPIILQSVRSLILTGCNMILMITDDKKLVRKARNTNLGADFLRISCRDWVSISGDSELVLGHIREFFDDNTHCEIIIDSGSLETFMDKTGSSYSCGVPYTEYKPFGWTTEIRRPTQITNRQMASRYRRREDRSLFAIIALLRLCTNQGESTVMHLTRSTRNRRRACA